MLNPENLTEAVIDYLQTSDTEYAIMINGKWGCGKTYFWNKHIVPRTKDMDKKCIYVSLFGVKSESEIENKILYQLIGFQTEYNIKKSDVSSVLSELPKYLDSISNRISVGKNNFKPIANIFTGVASQLIFQTTLYANKEKYLLCFDDLERADSVIDIVKTFGYINRFVEHQRIKTILICNEDEVDDPIKYQKYKEKLVEFDYKISPSLEQIIDYFTKNYSKEVRDTLAEHKEQILEVLYRCELQNLRILKSCLKFLNKCIQELDLDNRVKSYDWLILLVFSLTIEKKKGSLKEEQIKMLREWIEQGYDFTYSHSKEDKDKSVSYLTNFLHQYYGDNVNPSTNYQITSKAVFEYIITGYFDRDLFIQDLDKIINTQDTPQEIFLRTYWHLSDDEFTEVKKEYVTALQNCELTSPLAILRLCQALFRFSNEKLIVESHDELEQIFTEALNRLSQRNLLEYEEVSNFYDERVFKDNSNYQNIAQLLIRFNNQITYHTISKQINSFFSILSTDPEHFFCLAYQKHEYKFDSILRYCNVLKLRDIIWELENPYIRSFKYYLSNRCKYISMQSLSEEKPNLLKLKNLLEKDINNQNQAPRSLKCHLIAELKEEIDKIINKLD